MSLLLIAKCIPKYSGFSVSVRTLSRLVPQVLAMSAGGQGTAARLLRRKQVEPVKSD